MKVTSILLWTQENKVSEKFYKKLGFEVVRSDDQHSLVELGGFQITLVNMRDDVDEQYEKFIKLGIKPATKPRDWPWGNREFIVKDPDGYKLCFWHETKHD